MNDEQQRNRLLYGCRIVDRFLHDKASSQQRVATAQTKRLMSNAPCHI